MLPAPFVVLFGAFAAFGLHCALAFNVKTSVLIDPVDGVPVIVVGNPFSVWKRDGPSSVWQRAVISGDVPARQEFSAVLFKQSYYIFGGQACSEQGAAFGDVWMSETGETWTQIVSHAPWSARHNVSVTEIDGQLVVYGGQCGPTRCDDAWSSPDGRDWFPYTMDADTGAGRRTEPAGPLCRDCDGERGIAIHCPLCAATPPPAANCSGHGAFHANNNTCSCDIGWAGYNCSACAEAFYGPDCVPCDGQTVSSNGTFLPCNGHGVCDGSGTHDGKGTCSCDYNWGGGLTCSYCTNFFAGDECQECDPGFWGPSCHPCRGFVLWEGTWCSGHGVCSGSGTQSGNGSCTCDPLWEGDPECSSCSPNRGGLDCTGCALNYWGPHCDTCPGYVPFYVPSCNEHGNCQGTGTTSGNGTCVCDAPFTGPTCSDCIDGYWGIFCNPCPALNTTSGEYCSGHGACTAHGSCACDRGYDLWNCSRTVPVVPSKGHELHPAAIALIAVGCVVLIIVVWQSVVVYRRTKAANTGVGVDTSMFLVTSAEEPDLDVGSQNRQRIDHAKHSAPEYSSR